MNIIKNLIKSNDLKDNSYSSFAESLLNLNELELYLHNMDRIAKLQQQSNTDTYMEQKIVNQNRNLMKVMQSKILKFYSDCILYM